MHREVDQVLKHVGYRYLPGRSEEVGVYYRYYQEGFHVVVVVDQTKGFAMRPEQQQYMVEWVMSNFYRPQGILPDFPQGFPVYRVEALTLLIGGAEEQTRTMCTICQNTWVYRPEWHRVIIYENQPGDFYGLQEVLEQLHVTSAQKKKTIPYVTYAMIALNIFVYLVMELFGSTYDVDFVARYGAMHPFFLREHHQWWRLLTAGFIHIGVGHLVNNMLVLYGIGERLERAVGNIKMLIIYLLSLLGGTITSYIMMLLTGAYAVSAGASGAVFGVIGGFLWVIIMHKGKWEGVTAKRLAMSIGLMIYYGFTTGGVDNAAHIGGMITGFVISAILYHRKRQKD